MTPDLGGIVRRHAALALAGVAIAWLGYELRRAQRDLEAAQQRTRAVVDHVGTSVAADAARRIVEVDRASARARRREATTTAAPADLAHARESDARGEDWDARLEDALARGRRAGAR